MTKIKIEKTKNNNNVDTPFYEYFTLNNPLNNKANNPNIKQFPVYCRTEPGARSKSKKLSCINCNQLCSYTMEMILHPIKSISHDDIIEELEIHGHPTSRKFANETGEKRNRNKIEAARELADHFIYAHDQKEPSFL